MAVAVAVVVAARKVVVVGPKMRRTRIITTVPGGKKCEEAEEEEEVGELHQNKSLADFPARRQAGRLKDDSFDEVISRAKKLYDSESSASRA